VVAPTRLPFVRQNLPSCVSHTKVFLVSRNTFLTETELVRAAVEAFRGRLPKAWNADVIPEPKAPPRYDAVFTLTSANNKEATFAVEAKSAPRGSVQDVVRQLRAMVQLGKTQLMFITEYASPPLRRELDEAGISYLDTTGWASLTCSDPLVLIRLEGAPKPPRPREAAATMRLTGPAAARAIRHLLESHPPLGIRELATLSSSSPAAVSKLMPALVDAGAIERSEEGTITRVRKRTLLDRWTADYSFVNGNGLVLDYIAPRGVARALDRIRDRGDVTVTGSAAAREYLPSGITSVVPLGLLTLYGSDITSIARSLELVRSDRTTSNVLITAPRDRTLLEEADTSASGLRIAPIGQVLADLLTVPRGRLAQEAEQLIDLLARDDDTWRE
jgi:DNA-binding transcriptional ArsR family regulator